MSRALLVTALALSAAVSACAPTLGPPPPPPGGRMAPADPSAFRSEDFSWSAIPGRGGIAGHVAYRQGTTRFTCAGASVVLTPETPWTRRRMTLLYMSPERAALPVDQVRARTPPGQEGDYSSFVRRTTCNAADQFNFQGLPDGAWYAITIAKPATGSGPSIALMRRVVTRGARVVNVEL